MRLRGSMGRDACGATLLPASRMLRRRFMVADESDL